MMNDQSHPASASALQKADFPSWRRVLLALVIAPITPSILLGLSGSYPDRLFMVLFYLVVGEGLAVAIGLPVYYLLRRFVRPRAIWCALVGGAVPLLPFLGQLVTSPQPIRELAMIFGSGALGGFAFWLIAVKLAPQHKNIDIK